MKKLTTKQKHIIICLVLIAAMLILVSHQMYKQSEVLIQAEVKSSQELVGIWEEIENIYIDWKDGNIDREQMATEGYKLFVEFEALKVPREEVQGTKAKQARSLGDSLKLKTEVMLFDMLRGYDVEGNPYKDRDILKDETLDYVTLKRKDAFEKDYNFFIETFDTVK